jgi:hypothetical protein
MPKFKWEVKQGEYRAFDVTANTRALATAIAESEFMAMYRWEDELVGELDDEGKPFVRSTIPEFTVSKIGRV